MDTRWPLFALHKRNTEIIPKWKNFISLITSFLRYQTKLNFDIYTWRNHITNYIIIKRWAISSEIKKVIQKLLLLWKIIMQRWKQSSQIFEKDVELLLETVNEDLKFIVYSFSWRILNKDSRFPTYLCYSWSWQYSCLIKRKSQWVCTCLQGFNWRASYTVLSTWYSKIFWYFITAK